MTETMEQRRKIAALVFVVLFSMLGLTCTSSNEEGGGDDGVTGPGVPGAPGPFDFLAGTWDGTWEDTRFGVSGNVGMTVTINGNVVTAEGTIDLSSLGLGNEVGSAAGTVSGNSLDFTFQADTVGNGQGGMANGGPGSGTGSVAGVLNFGDFTFEGTTEPTMIQGTFEFVAASGGRGVVELTKQP